MSRALLTGLTRDLGSQLRLAALPKHLQFTREYRKHPGRDPQTYWRKRMKYMHGKAYNCNL